MTLDEAIKHATEVADHYDELIKTDNHGCGFNGSNENCVKCANEHRQLADWLSELKKRRDSHSDLISRQAAIDALSNDIMGGLNYRSILSNLPSSREWIPCHIRKPKYREDVILSTFWGVKTGYRDGIEEDGTDDFYEIIEDDATCNPVNVDAWMSLPPQYKGERT